MQYLIYQQKIDTTQETSFLSRVTTKQNHSCSCCKGGNKESAPRVDKTLALMIENEENIQHTISFVRRSSMGNILL